MMQNKFSLDEKNNEEACGKNNRAIWNRDWSDDIAFRIEPGPQ
tara:strand:- start:9656 stop:9784 length:129 start_codon:yes stop_codon:yes gene_type:complete